MKISTAIIAVLAALFVPVAARAETIKIGAILTLTGSFVTLGTGARDGLQLAIEEINKRGGVNGSKIELIIEDSKSDPQAGVAGFGRIEAGRQPLLYVSNLSSIGVALAPVAEEKRVALVGIATAALDFTRSREWIFRYWPLGQAYVPPLMRILQDLKVKELGILYQNDEFGKEQRQLMSKEFTSAGRTVATESIEVKDTDYRQKITALRDREAIYVACSGTLLLNVIRQIREADYRGFILTPTGTAMPDLFGLPDLAGIYLASPIIYNHNYLYAKDAGQKFEARYKRPLDQWAAVGYDFIKLLAGLLEDRQISRQTVRDMLAGGFEYSGVFGQVRVKAGEHDLTFPLFPAQIVNGTLKYR
jgi:ABC-type branched-subunit amino acid transport system substrate-binding protein